MPKAPPSFDFFPNDWIGGTRHLPLLARACYLELLLYQWQNGHIPQDPAMRMQLCGVPEETWRTVWDWIKEKFEPINASDIYGIREELSETTVLVNIRLHDDRQDQAPKYQARRKRNKANGNKGGRPKVTQIKPSGLVKQNPNVTQNKPTSEGGRGKGEVTLRSKVKQERSECASSTPNVIYSTEFYETWHRWTEHHFQCTGQRLEMQTEAQLMQLLGMRDEAKATSWVEHSLRVSTKGNICDPDAFRKKKPKEIDSVEELMQRAGLRDAK